MSPQPTFGAYEILYNGFKIMRYRRMKQKGGTYFFTVNLANRQSDLLIKHINDLREVMKKVKLKYPFDINAIVVLPEHLHTIWTLPKEDAEYSKRWMLIKSGFSRKIPKTEFCSKSRIDKGERGIWQRRYWEHVIQDEKDYENHVNYIHYNPVKHGYTEKAADWEFSSVHRFIGDGIIDKSWGVSDLEREGNYGERK